MSTGRSRSLTVLAVSTLGLGLAASGLRLAAWAQENVQAFDLRGSTTVAADDKAKADRAKPVSSSRARQKKARRTPPTAKPVRATLSGQTQADVAKVVQAPVAIQSPEPAEPVRVVRKRKPDDDPYAPLGWHIGGVRLYPSIEGDGGYDTNPNRLNGPHKGSVFDKTEGELRLQSDWENHELRGRLRGAYFDYPNVPAANRPDGEGQVSLRLDVRRDLKIDLESHFKVDTERPGAINLPNGATGRTLDESFGGSAAVTQKFNRVSLGLKGGADHYSFGDVKLGDGTTVSQADRNYAQYALRLRSSYELKPGVEPFVEAEIDARRHDQTIDNSGFARDSNGLTGRVGSTFALTRLLTGEIAVGYQRRRFDDPRLQDLNGPVGHASLIWSLSPLTTVRLTGEQRLDETSVVGSNGTIARNIGIEVEHALMRNLTLTASASFQHNDYNDLNIREKGFSGSLRVDYKLTREWVVRGSVTHEQLESSAPGRDYAANVFLLGLRLQR